MHRKRIAVWTLVVGVAALGMIFASAAGSSTKAEPYKVAWIYPGPHNDHGWSQAHDAGRLYVMKKLGSRVQTTYKENIFSNAQIPQVVAGLVRDGYKMIFGCSFGNFSNGVNGQLYAKYPDVKFEEATGTQIKKNQSQYFGAGEDTIYLSGMAAGAASKKGLIGYTAPFGTPEVVRHINAFTLGAQATHPGAKVKLIWTNAWYSPPKETQAAENLVKSGVDVLGQNVDSDATGVYAEKHGDPVGGLRLERADVGSEAVADGGGLQLGPVLPAARQGRDQRHVEARLLLRHDERRLHEHRAVRAEGVREDEGRDRREAQGDHVRQVQRLPGPALRPEGQADGAEGQDAQGAARPVLDAVARQGRDRESLLGPASWLSPVGEAAPLGDVRERGAGPSGASPPPAVRMVGICKRFPGVVANDDVTFEAAAGEVHALLGENGAGKTTLSNILTGLYRPDEGEIELYGEPVHFHSPRDALDAGICMVHQHFRLVAPFTVAENVVLGDHRAEGKSMLVRHGRIESAVAGLGDRYGLGVDPTARIWQLSVGEQQRVEILKALYREARILIMDEPTAVLTPQEAEELFETLRAMAADGKTVIFISHKLHEVMAVADRVTVLRGGKTVTTVDRAEASAALPRRAHGRARGRRGCEAGARRRAHREDVALSVEGLSAHGDRGGEALSDVSLRVRAGEIVAIVGVAGNGQRELAEAISGMRAAVGRDDRRRRANAARRRSSPGDCRRRRARSRGPARNRASRPRSASRGTPS